MRPPAKDTEWLRSKGAVGAKGTKQADYPLVLTYHCVTYWKRSAG